MRLWRQTRVLGSHLNLVMSGAEKIGYSIHHEPAIPTPAGIQRPDLVPVRNSNLTILDVTIVADNADLEKTHNDKCVYYNVPAIGGNGGYFSYFFAKF